MYVCKICVLQGRVDELKKKPQLLRVHQSKTYPWTFLPSDSFCGEARRSFLFFTFLPFAGMVVGYEWGTWPLLLSPPAQILNPPAGCFLLISWHSLKSLLDVELHFAWRLFCLLGTDSAAHKNTNSSHWEAANKGKPLPNKCPHCIWKRVLKHLCFCILLTHEVSWLLGHQLAAPTKGSIRSLFTLPLGACREGRHTVL